MRFRLRAAAFLALIFAGITCSEPATGPKSSAGLTPARLYMVPQFSAAATSAYGVLTAAGTDVTEIHIVLTAPDGSTRDTVIAFPVGQDSRTIEIDVADGTDGQPYTALIELRSSDHTVLFSGTQVIIARPGNFPPSNPPTITINYTGPGRTIRTVTVTPRDTTVAGTPTLAYIATAVDSAGAPVTNLLVAWTSSDVTIATATSTGNAVASVAALGKRGTTTISARTPLGVTGTAVLRVVPPLARLVVISGGGQTGTAGSQLPQPFVVEAQASDNLPVPGTSITFRSVTAGGSVAQSTPRIADASGRASVLMTLGTSAGAYVYEAATTGVAPVTVSQTATGGLPSAIAIFSGNLQSEVAGRALPLPLVVRVTDQFGGAVGGAVVTWARTSGVGTVGSASTTTASDGTASISYLLGATAGTEVITATLQGGASVQFTATATAPGAGSITVVSGGGQTGTPNSLLANPLVVRVADAGGLPLAGQLVTFTSSPNGATFNPTSFTTGANGLASTAVTLGATPGAVTLTAVSGALSVSTSATIAVGPAASITKVAGDLQTATVASAVAVAPSVVVKDAGGNPVPNAPVVFAVTSGGGSVTGASVNTNAQGVATVGSWTLGALAGSNSLSATSGALSTSFTATAVAGTGSILALTTSPSATAVSGVALATQPVVQLRDAGGNNVSTAGVVITASITSGSGTLMNATATTGANGAATFSGLGIAGTVGSFTLQFSAPSFTPVSFGPIALSAGAPSVIALSAGNNQTATVGTAVAVAPAVIVTDASGNPVTGANVTFGVITAGAQISNGTTTGTTLTIPTGANGVAALTSFTLGSSAQNYVLNATATGLTGSPVVFTATAVAGTGSQLAFVTLPPVNAASDVAFTSQPVVQLKDANGNNVTTAGVVVTAGITSGTGTVVNGTATTIAGGTATFNGLAISGTAGSFTLSFSSPGVTPLTSAPITLVAGPAVSITIIAGNNQTSPAGLPVPVAPSVLVRDNALNPVAGVVVTFDAGTSGATVANASTSGTSVTVTSNASGQATLTSWTLGSTPTQYALTASAPVQFGSPLTFTANATAGAASQLAFSVQPPSTASIGVPLAPQPVIQLKDAFGNNAATAGVVVNALISQGGTLVNASATTNAAGTATFSGLGFTGATGNFTLQFGATGFTNLVFGTIAVGAGSPSTIALSAGNNQSATVGTAVPVAPAVLVTDASGNPVAGTVVTFNAVTAGSTVSNASTTGTSVTVTTNAQGIAALNAWTLGSQAGPYAMTASATGLTGSPVSFSATAVAGGGTVLALVQVPSSTQVNGVPLVQQPIIQLRDALGNNVTTSGVSVTAQITGGTGGLSNAVATTNASGTASFANLTISGAVGSFSLQFSAPGYTPVSFSPIQLTVGAPTTLAIHGGNSQAARVGTPVPIAPAAVVTDQTGNRVPGVNVTFTVVTAGSTVSNGTTSGNTVTVATDGAGVATLASWTLGNTAQTYTMDATVAGLTGSPATFTAIALAGAGTQLAFTQQPSVSTTSGAPLAVQPVVQLRDAQGNNVSSAGTTITATIISGSGTLSNATAVTNGAGSAAFSGLAITGAAGSYTLQFSSPGYSNLQAAPITVNPGAPVALAFRPAWTPGPTPTLSAFNPAPSVQVVDASGNAVATSGVALTATIASGPSSPVPSVSGGSATTNASGLATFPGLNIGGAAGTYTLTFTGGGLTPVTSGGLVITNGPGTTLTINAGNNQTAPVSTAVPVSPAVVLTDAFGNAVPNQLVTFTVLTAGSVLSNGTTSGNTVTVQTNASGLATLASWTLGATAGAYNISAAFQGAQTIFFGATAVPGPASSIALNAGNNQTAPVGTSLATPPSVVVRDANGNGVGGVVVQFTVVTPGATVSNGSTTATTVPVTTNPGSGIAQLNAWTMGQIAQTYTMNATLASVTGSPVTFTATATAGSPSALAFTQSPSASANSGAPLAVQPVVRLTDSFGNTIQQAGVVVTASITSGSGSLTNATATTNGSGVATFSGLTISGTPGSFQLSFAATGYASLPFGPLTLNTGSPSAISLNAGNNQTAVAGQSVATPPSVLVVDGAGNPVSGVVVTFNAVTAGSQISNASTSGTTLTVTTGANGIAALNSWTLGGTPQQYTLTASAAGLTGSPVTFTATATVGPASSIALQAGNNQSTAWGTAVPLAPSVIIRDASGNPVAGTVVTFTPVTVGGQVQNASTVSTGPLTVTSNAQGIAALVAFYVGNTAQQYTLTATVSGLTGSPVTFTETALPGPSTHLSFTTTPSTSANSGAPLIVQPVVQLRDAPGNAVPTAGVTIVATITSGSGTLSNATAVTNASGQATFTGLTLSGIAGAFTLSFRDQAASLAPVTSNVTLSPGSASRLAIAVQGSSTVVNGQPLATAPQIRVQDAAGNNVAAAGVTIVATITSGNNGSLSNATATTNGAGIATFTGLTITGIIGNYTLAFNSSPTNLTPISLPPINVTIGPASNMTIVAGNGQTATVSTQVPVAPSALITDVGGNPVGGVAVFFSFVQSTNQQIQNTSTCCNNLTVTSNAQGIASLFSWTMGNGVQLDTVTATAQVGQIPLTGSPLRFISQAVASNGNTMSFTVRPTTPHASGVALSPAPGITLRSPTGSPVAGAVITVSIQSQGTTNAVLAGTTATATTNASGLATFNNLVVTGSPGSYTLRFTTPGAPLLGMAMTIQ